MEGPIRLVVGLGNPGPRYEGTRHNVGFAAVDLFAAADAGASWSAAPAGDGLVARVELGEGLRLWAAKPQTFMNASGAMVAALARYLKVRPQELLVVSDDFSLPLGRVRLRMRGSSGGQKGLASILESLGSQEVPRLRLGIGPVPARVDPADFVLGRFAPSEREAAESMAGRAAEAIRAACLEGLEAAMNRYNPA